MHLVHSEMLSPLIVPRGDRLSKLCAEMGGVLDLNGWEMFRPRGSMRRDFRPSTRSQFSLAASTMCRANVVGLIYMIRSVVKALRMLVAHDSRKQK